MKGKNENYRHTDMNLKPQALEHQSKTTNAIMPTKN